MKIFKRQFPVILISVSLILTIYYLSNPQIKLSELLLLGTAFIIFGYVLCYHLERDFQKKFSKTIDFLNNLYKKNFESEKLDKSIRSLDPKLFNSLEELSKNLAVQFEKIESEKNQLETILGAMSEGVMVVSQKGDLLLINNAAKAMFQIEKLPELRPYWEVIRNKSLQNLISRSQEKKETIKQEISIIYPEEKFFLANVELINSPSKETIIVIFDITEFKKLEKIKADFIANVSHELRTPLTSIKGYLETLIDEAYDSPMQRNSFLNVIDKNTNRLISLVSDLLILSELEGKGQPQTDETRNELEIIDIKEAVFHSVASLETKFLFKNINEKIEIEDDLHPIRGDKFLIEQMLTNLIDNAVKYTPENGNVSVKAYSDNSSMVIEVKDSGIGIPKEHQDRIFERFYRVDKDRSRKMGGTGLGLSIVKHTVIQHGGSIKVESEEQKGTKFTIKLPYDKILLNENAMH
ncbi:MAG: sensor histidine kinase [Thermodesulfobacteriota bacterium]